MEEGDINLPPNGRQQQNKRIARSKTFGRQEGLTRRNCSGQGRQEGLTRSKTFGGQEGYQIAIHEQSLSSAIRQEGSSSVSSFPTQLGQESLIITINSDATNGTSQGEHPSPSPTNGTFSFQVVASSSEICQTTSSLNSGTSQGEDPISPSATNGIASSSEICQATSSLNSGTSQGEDPISPSAAFDQCQINGKKIPGKTTLDEYYAQCVPLLQATMKGDWLAAKAFLKKYPDCVRAPITKEEETTLHIAAAQQHSTFIKNLLKLMDRDDLKLKTNYGFTALHFAAQVGNVIIANQLFEMNNEPLLILDADEDTPLIVAAYLGHANMVSYLFSLTRLEMLTDAKRMELLHHTIYNDMYDIALKILKTVPNIATANTECWWEALEMLARKPFAIGSESQLSFWKSFLNSC